MINWFRKNVLRKKPVERWVWEDIEDGARVSKKYVRKKAEVLESGVVRTVTQQSEGPIIIYE